MSGNKNKKIAFNYFGGKFTWLEYLYANFPAGFTHLVDLFAGSMVVSINYHGNVIRTANEINGEITNFFAQLRDHEEEPVRALRLTPYSEAEFDNSWVDDNAGISDLERARRFYVRVRQSFFGLGAQRQKKAGTWPNNRSEHRPVRVYLVGKMPSRSCTMWQSRFAIISKL